MKLKSYPLPFFEEGVHAGFPSPADDFLERPLDLHELLIAHPAATFFIRVQGDSMEGVGIFGGDILIVDRSLQAKKGDIIVALIQGEFAVKRLSLERGKVILYAANPLYPPLPIEEGGEFEVWGVVTYVIHRPK